ncbi:TonB-dependent receptor, partial [Tenacibaculum sp.]|nr:TonB-dependent receptor [Tenacibaculum sp.]
FNGDFQIVNPPNGDYKLTISYIGYKTKEININSLTNLSQIILYEGNEILHEVIVDTKRKNKFSRKQSAYVAKLPLKNLENSQVYSTVTNQLLISQSVTSFEEALKNTVGVEKLWSSTGRSGDGAGYYSIRGFSVQPQLVNGVPGITNGFINPDNVERIEVIKGPSATLFGSTITSYGGLINVVTKKPYNGTGGNISVAGGSFGFKKVTADLNVTDESENFSLRLNTGYQSQDSFQNQGFKKSMFLAPAISYKANNKLTFNVSYELSYTDQTNPTFLFLNRSAPLAFKNLSELNYNPEKSLTNDDVSITNPTQNYRGEIAYKISDNWSSQTIIAGGNAKSKGYYTFLWNPADRSNPAAPVSLPFFALNAQKTDAETNTFNVQQNITGDFKIGTVRNRIVFGLDYLESQTLDKSSNWKAIHAVTPQGQVVNGLPINRKNISLFLNGVGNSNTDVNQNVLSGYVSNVINILPELSVMAGVRYDRFQYKGDANNPSDDATTYTKSTFSPKFGAVYQPILNKLSVFANYQNGFSYVNPELVPIDPSDLTKVALKSFDLEQANQYEFGVKTNLFNNKLETTLSYYNITVKDKVMGFGPSKLQDGTVNSKGVELEINASPIEGLNLRGGFSYNDAKVTKSASRPDLINKRFEQAGPSISYNFWGDYKFQEGIAKDFGVGFGFNGVNNYDTMVGYPNVGEFILPAYTILNASVYYEIDKFRIGVKANNLTDKKYYKGWSTISPQQQRSFLASFTYKF